MVKLETERLIIRDNIEEDLNELHNLMSDKEVNKYDSDFYSDSLDSTKNKLKVSIEEAGKKDRRKYWFAIIEKESEEYVGQIGITIVSNQIKNGIGQMAYFIQKKYWGRGYTTEAAKKVIDFTFEDIELHKIITGCLTENIASEKIMKKCNMVKEAELIKHVWHENKWKNRVEYRLLKVEWERINEL
jgi:ribosomal-protein-alanine N-acetyltransferase